MTEVGPYVSPAAFRRALTDKLKALAKESKWGLPQLQRQMAYDRHTLDEALDVVRPFLDPLLDGTARGTWDRDGRQWTG